MATAPAPRLIRSPLLTPLGKVIGGLVAFFGLCAVALPVGIVSSGFIEELGRRGKRAEPYPETCPHCGGALDHLEKSS